MAASPQKIKAYLARVKECYLDDDNNETSSLTLSDRFAGILKMELLLRGIILSDDSKLWSQIQSSVGKSLLEDIPKPLLAGANVMAGRVTEAFCHQWQASTKNERSAPLFSADEAAGSLQRGKDIEDERWLILFRSEYHNAVAMFQVALGYFTTAAQIQPDTPPMWKKVWDTWTILRDAATTQDVRTDSTSSSSTSNIVPTFEAQVAIDQQSRIALSKGNTKRSNELQLRLAQSCLIPERIELSTISFSANRKVTLKKTILECFGDTLTGKLESSKLRQAKKAVQALESCQVYFDEQVNEGETTETLLFLALTVEALIVQEEAQIQAEAEELFQASQNRSLGKGCTTLAECVQKSQETLVISSNKGATIPFETCTFLPSAIKLRDRVIQFWERKNANNGNSQDEAEFAKTMCFTWVTKTMDRLIDYARILSHNTGSYYKPWNRLLEFVLPVVIEMQRQCSSESGESLISKESIQVWLARELGEGDFQDSSTTQPKLLLIASVVIMVPEIYWMMLGDEKEVPKPMDPIMSFLINVSSELIKIQEAREKKKKENADGPFAVGVKTQDPGIIRLKKLHHAKDIASCFVCQDDERLISKVTADAIQCKIDAEQPLGFLRCLISWSGWYRHPWSFCANLTETRRILGMARSDQGRPLTRIEEILLEMATADAELLNGGFFEAAYGQYERILVKLKETKGNENDFAKAMLQTHCYNGMSRVIQMREVRDKGNIVSNISSASIEILESFEAAPSTSTIYVWHSHKLFVDSRSFQLSVARQLMADALMDDGLISDAKLFLEAAVRDSPTDSEAALSFGAFLLKFALFYSKERSQEDLKAAQLQLLKAAKLDPSKADPFALLGVWFEHEGDNGRALGCFRKSLAIDPCNPVAGRGLLRLKGRENLNDVLEMATDINSPCNGWAWYAIGLNKAYVESNDELAVIAILKGLRCRDIAQPNSEKHGMFLNGPTIDPARNEEASALADVAKCYRRLGKYTASIRSFHASIASAGAHVPFDVLISCARVESELGLFDDAAEKFSDALETEEGNIALYGYATALFSMAQRDFGDGKVGSAFASLKLAIDCCLKSPTKFACQLKLLGDLYSHGASFPPNIFIGENSADDAPSCVRAQIRFVSEGEIAYRQCLDICPNIAFSDVEEKVRKSYVRCDIATNILRQAQLLSGLQDLNSGPGATPDLDHEVDAMYECASRAFQEAIAENPILATAWCGLGCSVVRADPILAQHAFCRATELDKMAPDAYVNVGLLYTSKLALDPSRQTMEVLTEVADTPKMWMNCAFILEREAAIQLKDQNTKVEEMLGQAADAYRSALQVTRHPEAQLGLAMTSRVKTSNGSNNGDEGNLVLNAAERKESSSLFKEYCGGSTLMERQASALHSLLVIEQANEGQINSSWTKEAFEQGKIVLKNVLDGDIVGLNKPSLQKVAEAVESRSLRTESTSSSETMDNIQDGTLNEPVSPETWISHAKECIKSDKLVVASEAARKAAVVLAEKLNNPGTSTPVRASMVSGAISLDIWLKLMNNTTEESSNNEKDNLSFELQRALLMDPSNIMARRGLVG
ncbi:tetratricopeptide repeat protein [Nitzschia inconspicua]|uniref:Tetratricopeptide repeat protein n=1 Tax=Nitzschia inconspicua TaxID=303405 RepID=A0A9K3KMY8_9STRA|nr:tetratricopeptide repeat protein [Nitzschia inconspicua]